MKNSFLLWLMTFIIACDSNENSPPPAMQKNLRSGDYIFVEKENSETVTTITDTTFPGKTDTALTATVYPNYDYIQHVFKGPWIDRNGPGSFFYSSRVDQLLKSKKKTPDDHGESLYYEFDILGVQEIKKLYAKDLLYYCLAHPCAFNQNCSPGGLAPQDGHTYMSRDLPSPEADNHISELQEKNLNRLKDSITLILIKGLNNVDTIDLEYLHIANRIQLTGLIPLLCEKAGFRKNPYIYTVLYQMMSSQEYQPFVTSAFYKRVFETFSAWGEVRLEQKDADLLVKYAQQFYRSKNKTK